MRPITFGIFSFREKCATVHCIEQAPSHYRSSGWHSFMMQYGATIHDYIMFKANPFKATHTRGIQIFLNGNMTLGVK